MANSVLLLCPSPLFSIFPCSFFRTPPIPVSPADLCARALSLESYYFLLFLTIESLCNFFKRGETFTSFQDKIHSQILKKDLCFRIYFILK